MPIMMWSEKYLSFATFIYVIIIINNIIEISHSMKCDVGTEYFEDRNEGPMCKECNVGDYNDVPLSDNPSCKNCPNDKPYGDDEKTNEMLIDLQNIRKKYGAGSEEYQKALASLK